MISEEMNVTFHGEDDIMILETASNLLPGSNILAIEGPPQSNSMDVVSQIPSQCAAIYCFVCTNC